MPLVTIVKEFTLTHQDGTPEIIPPGTYDFEPELADHWYVMAHSDQAKPVRPRPGMPSYQSLYERYQGDQDIARQQERQIAHEAATSATTEFRDSNQQARRRRPNERVPLEQSEEGRPRLRRRAEGDQDQSQEGRDQATQEGQERREAENQGEQEQQQSG